MTDKSNGNGNTAPTKPAESWAYQEAIRNLDRLWAETRAALEANAAAKAQIEAVMYRTETDLAYLTNAAETMRLSPAEFRRQAEEATAQAIAETTIAGLTDQQRRIATAAGMPLATYAAALKKMRGEL